MGRGAPAVRWEQGEPGERPGGIVKVVTDAILCLLARHITTEGFTLRLAWLGNSPGRTIAFSVGVYSDAGGGLVRLACPKTADTTRRNRGATSPRSGPRQKNSRGL